MRSRVGIPGYLLSPKPADLPPLDVPIDHAKWNQPKNQGRPRNQSVEGQQEIKRSRETPRMWGDLTSIACIGLLSSSTVGDQARY